MTKRRASPTQVEIARAVRAVQALGIDIARVEIDKDGKIVVVTTTGTTTGDAIDQELEAFGRAHGTNRS